MPCTIWSSAVAQMARVRTSCGTSASGGGFCSDSTRPVSGCSGCGEHRRSSHVHLHCGPDCPSTPVCEVLGVGGWDGVRGEVAVFICSKEVCACSLPCGCPLLLPMMASCRKGHVRLCPQLLPGFRMRPEERGAYIATRVHRQDMGPLHLSCCPMPRSHYLMYHYLPSMYHYWSVRSPGTHRAHPYLVSSARSHDGRRGP